VNKTKLILIVIILLSTIALGIAWALWSYLDAPPPGDGAMKSIEIPSGLSFSQVASILEREGIIAGSERFRWLAWLKRVEKEIKAGDYTFNTAMRPSAVLHMLVEGRYKTITVTIPEGFTVAQIAQVLQEKGCGNRENFLNYASDPLFVRSLGIKGDSLEGFLFPDTYKLRKGMAEELILREMVGRFNEVFNVERTKRLQELGLSREEVIILASIIEKETSDTSERYLIAAVFHNRLKRGMLLQSDPTVIYGLHDFDGNLTKDDLKTSSPYNTYLMKGLPPRPIANPGEESIIAALYPASEKYLYFVSKNNGTHHFSTTLEEHNRAVDRYQRKRKRARKN
jgi:UPF0755 protein